MPAQPDAADSPFDPQVIAAVTRHMNDDHASDCLLIVRGLGGLSDATAAVMSGMSPAGIELTATVGERVAVVDIPWSVPITTRADVRLEAVRMVRDAAAQLGVEITEHP